MKHFKYLLFLSIVFVFVGCFKDLDTIPLDPTEETAENVFQDHNNYKLFLARLYAGLSVTGQEGPAGRPDISGIDEGFSQYLRGLFYVQELTTDEALIAWNDATIQDFHSQTWAPSDGFLYAFYSRIFYQINICNEFLRETTEEKLNSRNVPDNIRQDVQLYREEARFLRALSYWHALDHFRNVPFVTENNAVGSFFPEQINANDLFDYIESELKDIENTLLDPKANEYGRADKAAVWTLLAKLYLNAEVYTGQNKYQESLEYSEKVIASNYSLDNEYSHLFLADNHLSNEVIFPILFDGDRIRTYGGTTFIINAAIGGTEMTAVSLEQFGMQEGWAGLRVTPEFYHKFPQGGSGGLISAPNPGKTSTYPVLYVHQTNANLSSINTEIALSGVSSPNIFEGYVHFSSANTEFKLYRVPSLNAPPNLVFGSEQNDGTLQNNSRSIAVNEPGLYYIKADLTARTYLLEKKIWTIEGSAITGSVEMTWNAQERVLEAETNLTPGSIIFRTTDGDVLGDSDGDGLLEVNGGEIEKIIEEANHKIRLFISRPDYTYQINSLSFDRRPLFFTKGQTEDIENVSEFTNGIAVAKYRNIRRDGSSGVSPTFSDVDFPLFRLGDVYLMASESAFRLGNVSLATQHLNKVRERAFQSTGGNISESEISLDYILDERARELYWECHRRTDLVRFGKFSDGDYLWQWKGGTKNGMTVPSYRDVFPIPSNDINANPNLDQNTGY